MGQITMTAPSDFLNKNLNSSKNALKSSVLSFGLSLSSIIKIESFSVFSFTIKSGISSKEIFRWIGIISILLKKFESVFKNVVFPEPEFPKNILNLPILP